MASQSSDRKKSSLSNDRRNIWLLIAMTVLLIASFILFMPPNEKINQALDIQGGLQVVEKASSTEGDTISAEDMETARAIIENRVNALGANETVVQVQGNDEILIQIPGLTDAADAIEMIGSTGKLEFARLDSFTDETVVNKIKSGSYSNEGTVQDKYGNTFSTGVAQHLNVEPGTYTPIVTGDNITAVRVDRAGEASFYYEVDINLDAEGAEAFAQASRDLVADHGQIVILLDGEVQSAPSVQSEIPNGQVSITGNYSLDEANALKIVLDSGSLPVAFEPSTSTVVGPTLGQDALFAGLIVALLGIALVMIYLLFFYKGLGTITAGAVVVFAILYLGILAGLSALGLFALSLPGIAGIVLTIGMAADSSVLTVERFREEIRMGKSVRAASITGVRHAIQTSIDADLVSLVSALSLAFLASASVRGFGVTLALGILCDIVMMLMFKAPLVRLLAPRAIAKHPGFWNIKDGQVAAEKFAALGAVEGVSASEAEIGEAMDRNETDRVAQERGGEEGLKVAEVVHNLKGRFIKHDINFVGHRKVLLIISACLVVASIAVIGLKGMDLSIEFVGGTSITLNDTGDTTTDELRAAFAEQGQGEATIQTTTASDGSNGFIVRLTVSDAAEAANIADQVATQFGVDLNNVEVSTIGPDWGASVIQQSLIAFIVSLVLIIIYIAIRFRDYKMGIVAVVTLLHDLIIVVGVYALVGREFSPNAVAALLTILGYSLYDTVVVFHRITDNVRDLNIRCSFMTMANHSLNQVFIRSINTTLTSLIPVIGMLVFGGETLKDFAFAMTIGLFIGCYSSIAVATPLYSIWKVREERYAKLEKKFGPRIGAFEFERSGAGMAGTLGNSKAARLKTQRVQAANAQAAMAAAATDSSADDVVLDLDNGTVTIGQSNSNALGPDGKPLYQQTVRNPKKGKKKRK
ncbi:MAG: protein translocase subunit SecD [Eggerthellaceae bacterium]|nr:protein translocase subunit SecD [Eggerthellaceae bacterium]